ncbi:unnamed protein product, partial [Phaeothamnion confervicola]
AASGAAAAASAAVSGGGGSTSGGGGVSGGSGGGGGFAGPAQELFPAPLRQGVVCLAASPRRRCLVAVAAEGGAFFLEEGMRTDFPGPMYPAGYTLLDNNTAYAEAEDELDTVVTVGAGGEEVRSLAREVVVPGKHEVTHEGDSEDEDAADVNIVGDDDGDDGNGEAADGRTGSGAFAAVYRRLEDFGPDELVAVPVDLSAPPRHLDAAGGTAAGGGDWEGAALNGGAAAAAAATAADTESATAATPAPAAGPPSLVARLLPPPAALQNGAVRPGQVTAAAAAAQAQRRATVASYLAEMEEDRVRLTEEAERQEQRRLERERLKRKRKAQEA